MNIAPVSCRTYNSACSVNQLSLKNQKSPSFKSTIIGTYKGKGPVKAAFTLLSRIFDDVQVQNFPMVVVKNRFADHELGQLLIEVADTCGFWEARNVVRELNNRCREYHSLLAEHPQPFQVDIRTIEGIMQSVQYCGAHKGASYLSKLRKEKPQASLAAL